MGSGGGVMPLETVVHRHYLGTSYLLMRRQTGRRRHAGGRHCTVQHSTVDKRAAVRS